MSQVFATGGQSIGFSFNISPSNEYLGLRLTLKLQYSGHLDEKSQLIQKDPDSGKD